MNTLSSLVPRPPCSAFVACSMKSGGRPGRIYHMMCAVADVMFSLLTSGFVLSPSLFFPWIQFVLSVQYVLIVASYSTWHQPGQSSHDKSVQAFPRFSYCKRQKLGVEAWERGYTISQLQCQEALIKLLAWRESARGGWPQHTSQSNYWFCHVTSEQLLTFIEYLYSMSVHKSECSNGSPLSKTPEVESQRHTMAFLWLGKQ